MNVIFFKLICIVYSSDTSLLVMNYFNQPHYSYGEKSILAGFCAFISFFWKEARVSVV